MPIERNPKSFVSPYDLELEEYWQKRQTKTGKKRWAKDSKYEKVAITQDWKCLICHDHLFNGEEIETHHIVPVAEGGSDDRSNKHASAQIVSQAGTF